MSQPTFQGARDELVRTLDGMRVRHSASIVLLNEMLAQAKTGSLTSRDLDLLDTKLAQVILYTGYADRGAARARQKLTDLYRTPIIPVQSTLEDEHVDTPRDVDPTRDVDTLVRDVEL